MTEISLISSSFHRLGNQGLQSSNDPSKVMQLVNYGVKNQDSDTYRADFRNQNRSSSGLPPTCSSESPLGSEKINGSVLPLIYGI